VAELWRYPVKSMLGERCEQAWLDRRGVAGDRLYAVRDNDGKLGSGKDSRRFRRIDGLFGFSARYVGTVPVLTFPDGHQVRGDDPSIDEQLRAALGRADLVLAREAAISHFDQAAVHLVTDASLSWLAARVAGARVDARRLRPNLLIRTTRPTALIEDRWVGRTARVGGGPVLEFTHGTARCVMVNKAQDDLPATSQVLRAVAEGNDLLLGIYARVVRSGPIKLGDELRLLG
jgi:MOSC domain-containing protein